MKPATISRALFTLTLLTSFVVAPAATKAADELVPLIVIDQVPLSDAIRNLARQMELNYILDPRVPGSSIGPGRLLKEPEVSSRWEKQTVRTALLDVLDDHKLTMVLNPGTSVARFAPQYAGVSPADTNLIRVETNGPIPLLRIEERSLQDAIKSIARRARLKVTFDPAFTASRWAHDNEIISIRWQNITARQALAALLDNFDLMMIEDAPTSSASITLNPKANQPPGKQR